MKRGADKDLTRDNADDDDDEEASVDGFRKAADTVLASRPMRGLPKRSVNTNTLTSTTFEPFSSLTSKTSGFSGSGFLSPSSSPFLPTPPATFTTQTGFQPPFNKIPPVAPNASNTAKTFASLLTLPSPTSDSALPQPSKLPPFDTPANADDPALFEYYKSLRGLNVSLLNTLSKVTEEDPFADISDLLDQYKALRLGVRKEFDEKLENPAGPSVGIVKSTFMPSPPAKFAGFGAFGGPSAPASTSMGNNSAGFKPQLPSNLLSTTTPGFLLTSTATPTPSASEFTFDAPPIDHLPASSNPFTPAPSNSSPFSQPTFGLFGTADKSTFSPAPFTGFGVTPPPVNNTEKSSPFSGSFTLGTASTTTPKSPFATTEKGTAPSFMVGSSVPGTNASVFGNIGSSPSTSIFGLESSNSATSSPPSKTVLGGFGGFGKAPGGGGSIGNPVGFGFGSPSKTPDAEAPPTGELVDQNGGQEPTTAFQDIPVGGDVETVDPRSKCVHDEEGAGEEDEDTVHAIKSKAFRMRKADEKQDSSPWVELGIGILRLKKHRESDSRRLLLRNSSTGKVNINFHLYSGLKPTQSKKVVTLIGHDDAGVSQTYSVRLASEEQAKALKEVLDREIALVKASSDD